MALTLSADTISITIMEIVDNAIMLLIPGAMEAGLDTFRFWGSSPSPSSSLARRPIRSTAG